MDFDRASADLSNDAAESIRQLNHRTRAEHDDWQYPGDAYSTVGNLAYLAGGLAQIRALMQRLESSGNLRSDKDTVGSDLGETFAGLDDARTAAEQLYAALNRAHAGLGSLAYEV